MPKYDYRCGSCDSLWEETRSMAARDYPAECPTCGGAGKRVFTKECAPTIPWFPDTTKSPFKK